MNIPENREIIQTVGSNDASLCSNDTFDEKNTKFK